MTMRTDRNYLTLAMAAREFDHDHKRMLKAALGVIEACKVIEARVNREVLAFAIELPENDTVDISAFSAKVRRLAMEASKE